MRKKIDEATCRYCGSNDIWLEVREQISASPSGYFSLAGVQMKFSALRMPSYWLVCDECSYQDAILLSEGKTDG